jgi:hypothetical protein
MTITRNSRPLCDATNQLEGSQTLHLVANSPWIPTYLFSKILSLDWVVGLPIKIGQCSKNRLLAQCQINFI